MRARKPLVRLASGVDTDDTGVSTVVFANLALLRLRRRWRSALALLLGLTTAVALATSVTLVQSTSAELGLHRTITSLDGFVQVTRPDTDSVPGFAGFAATTRHEVDSVGLLKPGAVYLASSALVPVTLNGRPRHDDPPPLIDLRYYPDLASRIEVTSGQMLSGRMSADPWPALVSSGAARLLSLGPGDLLCLSDFSGAQVCVEVAGVFQAREPGSAWWGQDGVPGASLILADEAGYFALVGKTPGGRSFAHATFAPDPAAFHVYRLDAILDSIRRLRGFFTVLQSSGTVSTGLDAGLTAYYQRFQGAQFALQLLLAEILMVALLYLSFVSGQVLDQQARALAVWRGRGWPRRSVFALLMLEFAIVAVVAIPVGLVLGALGAAGGLHFVYGGAPLDAGLADVPALWPPAVLALALGFAVLAWRAAQASRQSLIGAGRLASRPALRPWWQWRQLDLGLALLGAAVLFYAPAHAQANGGGASLDPTTLALAGVALVLLALAALRLLPPAAKLMGLLGRRLELDLASWQLSRRPIQHSMLALMLVVTMALGVFASSYLATERRNADDRAAYLAGADVRAHFKASLPFPPARQLARQAAQKVKGVEMVSFVYRGSGQPGRASESPTVLGVDPEAFTQVAWSRPGLDQQPLDRLLRRLVPGQGIDALPLPGRPTRLGVWIWSPGLSGEVVAAVEDGDGRAADVALGGLGYTGWRYLEAPIPVVGGGMRYPLAVRELDIQQPVPPPSGSPYPAGGTIGVADLSVTPAGATEPRVVEAFSPATAARWFATDSATGLNQGPLVLSAGLQHGGHAVVMLTPDTSAGDMVLRPLPAPTPLPALVPQRTLDGLGVGVGQVFPLTVDSDVVPVRLVGTIDWFPTTYPVENQEGQNPDFLILDESALLDHLAYGRAPHAWPNELWIRTGGPSDAALVELLDDSPAIDQVWSRRALLGATGADPLELQLGANLVVGFAAALALAVVAFGLHFLLATGARSAEYAILDASGLEPATVRRSLVAEQSVLLAFSLVAGALLGAAVAETMLPSLGFDPSLPGTIPPTVVTFDPALTGGALALVMLLSLLAGQLSTRAGRRLELMAELRMLS